MNRNFILLLLCILVQPVFGQEICNNAIDDDGDGLIDLNDSDCECNNLIDLSLIPNPSFEDMLCCPTDEAMMTCAENWVQASGATSDYYNFCGLSELPFDGALPPATPLPGGGEGFIGLYNFSTAYREYAGVCTSGPLLAGVTYALNLHTAYAFGDEDQLNLQLYGSTTCGDLPWLGIGCPEGIGTWQLLASDIITYEMDGSWQSVTLTFTPFVNINAIALGGPCGDIGDTEGSYFYFDEFILQKAITLGYIEESGGWCSEDILLTAVTDDPGGTWQWYKDGVALIGETSASLSPFTYGEGQFTAIYTYVDGCKRIDYDSPSIPTADFDFENVCLGDPVYFENTSTSASGEITTVKWDFDDGMVTNIYNPSHDYASSGTYMVSLIAYSEDASCNDTLTDEVTVWDKPIPDFNITGAGVSYTGIDWIGCAKDTLQFEDLTTVSGIMSLASWFWDFGDGSTSTLQNPEHYYLSSGTYVVKLVVIAESGCGDSISLDLILTDVDADFITDTICFGNPVIFNNLSSTSDGSIITSTIWTFGDDSDPNFTMSPTYIYPEVGTYLATLSVKNGLGCYDSIAKPVVIVPIPSPNFYASANPTDYFNTDLILTLMAPNPMSQYYWFMPEGLPSSAEGQPSVTVVYPEFIAANYEVTVVEVSKNGCTDSIKHIIEVREDEMIFAPNSFTPNGDPINPDWGIYAEGFWEYDFQLTIFNRWGELIWQTTNQNDRWDGTYPDGHLVQPGIYVWYVTARDQISDEKFQYTGTVNVLR